MRSSLSTFAYLAVLSALSTPVVSQVAVWGQCGGQYYSGPTTCAAGSTCVYSNPYYSQCLPGAASSSSSTPVGTPTTSSPTATSPSTGPTASNSVCPSAKNKFKFFGVNESGAEFGNTAIPGQLNKDYTFPSPSSIDYFVGKGFNTFRLPFLMERLSPPTTGLLGPFNQTYLSGLQTIISYITGKGAFVLLDPHNFMSYNGAQITDTTTFQTWWQNVASLFKSNNNVIFDIMNEPNGMDASVVFGLNQAAINGIRASGATTQLILLEGTSWTGAWTWQSSGNAAAFSAPISDPSNNFAIEMHQYLDSDGSGTSDQCVNATIGSDRLQVATAWLEQTGIKGFLGEIGAGSNPTCVSAVQSALCAMQSSDAWIGALWWAAGPWWGTYFQSIEPPSGDAVATILPEALEPFL
ncbi:hypothetical protein CVT26_014586 [Gymnopilus dilepis]|uniref:cellulase n=1 Tax=Gymnopilus dilepis TaxID=231916 RepID=A0A409VVM4_9AGAR|nr:hypothetical protein CVT26_014586 [Gymnopilus dilepis]